MENPPDSYPERPPENRPESPAEAPSPRRRRRRPADGRCPRPLRPEIQELVFPICAMFFERNAPLKEISKWVKGELARRGHRPTFSRQRVYDVVAAGIDLGYVEFHPPSARGLAQRLADQSLTEEARVFVVDTRGPRATQHVASKAAEVTFDLMRIRITERRMALGEAGEAGEGRFEIHIGLGAGYTSVHYAEHLAKLLRERPRIPGLGSIVLHAMNSGFSIYDPLSSPISYFRFFEGLPVPVEYVPLYSPSLVHCREYVRFTEAIGAKHAFERAGEIEIVVTSLASHRKESGLLDRIEKEHGIVRTASADGVKPVGDVQFRPYGEEGPIPDDPEGYRAVTLFELADYVRMAGEGKNIVLLAGPTESGETKADAMIPLITWPSLRVWTHLCVDVQTAEELVRALPGAAARGNGPERNRPGGGRPGRKGGPGRDADRGGR